MPDMLVRYKTGKSHFEVLTKEGTALKYRKGELSNLDDVLVTDVIFTDQHKGQRASEAELNSAFQTKDHQACLIKILQKGDVQVSSAERKAALDKKRLEIIHFIHKYYVDPKTKFPIPTQRIDAGLTEIKAKIDADTPTEKQVLEIVSKLNSVIPMKKVTLEGKITIPSKFAGGASAIVRKYATVVNEQHTTKGLIMDVQVIPGEYDTIMKELSKLTKGEFQFDVPSMMMNDGASQQEDKKGGGKGGKGKKK